MKSPPLEPRFVGRNGEINVVRNRIEAALGGSGQMVLIEGEAGIGKSRLLAEALGRVRQDRVTALRGGSEELERRRPFGVVCECLDVHTGSDDPRRRELADLLSSPGSAGALGIEGLEFRVSEAFLGLVDDLASARPVALAFDDIQWADPASLTFLHRLGRFILDRPIAVVAAYRPLPRPTELDALIASAVARGADILRLRPLTEEEVSELVEELVGAPPGPNLLTQVRAAAGSPVFVRELIASLDHVGAIARDGIAETVSTSLPESLTVTILHRISFLGRPTLEMLRVAAVLGSRFSTHDLSLATGRPVVELQTALRDSLDAGVLAEAVDGLEFRHDLLREALYNDLPGDIRSALHTEIGEALASAGAPAGRVAEHLLRGASRGDQAAVSWLWKAARDALATAPAVAAELLEQALSLNIEDAARDEMLAQRAQALLWSGNNPAAVRACRAVLDGRHDPRLEGTLRLSLLWAHSVQMRVRDALAEAEAGLAVETLTQGERARLRAMASLIRLFGGDINGAVAWASQAYDEAVAADDTWALGRSLETQAFVANTRGEFGRAVKLLEDAIRLAEAGSSPDVWQLPLHASLGLCLLDLDRLDDARDAVRVGQRINEEVGVRFSAPFYHYVAGMADAFAGQWDDALAEIQAGLGLADEFDIAFAAPVMRALVGVIAVHRDDLPAADGHITRAEESLGRGPRIPLVLWARALVLEAQGDVGAAAAKAVETWTFCTALIHAAEARVIAPDLVRLMLAGGKQPEAEAVAQAAEELARTNPGVPTLRGAALRSRGLVDADAEALAAATAAYRDGPRLPDLAHACEDAAAAMGDSGRKEEARALFDEALDLYERLGAVRDTSRAEARARACGLRRGSRARRTRPKFGWDALTPTEGRVAELVAQGMTNREIAIAMYLSPHTVHTHVSHVLAKVGVSSRVALAAGYASRTG